MLSTLKKRKREVVEIFLIVIWLALVLNWFADTIGKLFEKIPGWPVISALLFISTLIWVWLYYHKRKYSASKTFRVLYPLALKKDNKPGILQIPEYTPTREGNANSVLQSSLKTDLYKEEQQRLIDQFGLKTGEITETIGRFYFRSLNVVAVSQILKVIKHHGNHTFTPLGRYHPRYESIYMTIPHKEKSLTLNMTAGDNVRGFPKVFLIPDICKSIFVNDVISEDRKTKATRISINSKYVSLRIDIRHHWTVITQKKSRKIHNAGTRLLSTANHVSLLSIPIKMDLTLHSPAVLHFRKSEPVCAWFQFLYDELFYWLSFELKFRTWLKVL